MDHGSRDAAHRSLTFGKKTLFLRSFFISRDDDLALLTFSEERISYEDDSTGRNSVKRGSLDKAETTLKLPSFTLWNSVWSLHTRGT